jgi:hypothetical protein
MLVSPDDETGTARRENARTVRPFRLRQVSVVIVDTVEAGRAIRALEHCRALVAFRDAFLFTDRRVSVPPGITRIPIPTLVGIERYSEFMLWDLPKYSRLLAPFVLVIQHDGLVINPAAWNAEFLKYDYIGAPWIDGSIGNGGFSLRSRRLMEILPELLQPGNGRCVHPEDFALCKVHRRLLEDSSIKFAPNEIARQFSVENAPYEGSFGYHGAQTEALSGFSLAKFRPRNATSDRQAVNELLQNLFASARDMPSDINGHIETLARLAHGCEHVTEFGTRRGISTAGLLYGRPSQLVTYDMYRHPEIDDLEAAARAAGILFRFVASDVIGPDVPDIAPTDLLFIDTYHVYEQTREELRRHAHRVRRYIVFHDTQTFGIRGEIPGSLGIVPAIDEFLRQNPSWQVAEHHQYNNGLTVLQRIGPNKLS